MKLRKISIVIAAVFIFHTAAFAADVQFVNAKEEKPKFDIFSLFKKKDKPMFAEPLVSEPLVSEPLVSEPLVDKPLTSENPSKETIVTQEAEEFTAQDGMLNVVINTPKNGSLNSTVPGLEDVIFAIETPPLKGEVLITDTATGDFVYTPFEDEVGEDLFEFSATNETLGQKTATISVTISETGTSTEPPGETASPNPTATPTYTFRYEDMLGHWGETSAIKLAEDDILRGYKIGQKYFFYPETELTRGDFILYLVSALRLDVSEYAEIESPFEDAMETPAWMNLQAKAAFDAGIIKGSVEGDKIYLNASEKLTRLEAIAMLNNTIKPNEVSVGDTGYTDMYLVPDWGIVYIQNMTGYGLLKGYDDGTVRPYARITRAMAAEMINQTLMYKAENPEMIEILRAEMDKNLAY